MSRVEACSLGIIIKGPSIGYTDDVVQPGDASILVRYLEVRYMTIQDSGLIDMELGGKPQTRRALMVSVSTEQR
jgi:hypothetical protein